MAGMVTVPKSNGKIRIGMDLTKLNEIQLKPDAQPFAIMTPRRIPLPMKSKVKEELVTMDKLGVIRKVDKPTNWCAQGIGPDPDKTAAVEKMERPQNVAELRRFPGMIDHQQKFIETLSEKTMPIRDLLSLRAL